MQLNAFIRTKTGDITQECCDAIVNAANRSLMGGGGVDGAIHRAGGPAILEACRRLRETNYPDGLPTGEAVATTAGKMCAKYVIHTVGPIYAECGSHCAELLANCYQNALEEACRLGCASIAFPAISTGIYGYPFDAAARTACAALNEALQSCKLEVILIFHSPSSEKRFLEALA